MFASAPCFIRGSGGAMSIGDLPMRRIREWWPAPVPCFREGRLSFALSGLRTGTVRAGCAWPCSHFNYNFSRKIETQIKRFLAKPWLPAHPAVAGCRAVLGRESSDSQSLVTNLYKNVYVRELHCRCALEPVLGRLLLLRCW
jgi:hypothetical protein